MTIDMQQRISLDLTQMFDERALARYRHLVTHEPELAPHEVEELRAFRTRSGVPLLGSGGTDDVG